MNEQKDCLRTLLKNMPRTPFSVPSFFGISEELYSNIVRTKAGEMPRWLILEWPSPPWGMLSDFMDNGQEP